MALTLGIWLCALPIIFLLIGPAFGLKAAGAAAGGLLVVLALICWDLCAAKAPRLQGLSPQDREHVLSVAAEEAQQRRAGRPAPAAGSLR
jgi:hypothetical protein